MLAIELSCQRRRERPQRRCVDVVKVDMKRTGVNVMEVEDRMRSDHFLYSNTATASVEYLTDKDVSSFHV